MNDDYIESHLLQAAYISNSEHILVQLKKDAMFIC